MTDNTIREQILGKIHLAVRTEFFNNHKKNMEFLADDIEALLALSNQAARDDERKYIKKSLQNVLVTKTDPQVINAILEDLEDQLQAKSESDNG